MNFYPHHIGDFNNATRHLTRVERSLYADCIWLYYDTEQPLQAVDFDLLARKVMARTDEEITALRAILQEFFVLDGDVYRNERCDAELAAYRLKLDGASKAGKASAAKRAERKGNGRSTDVKPPMDSRSTNHEPRTINQEPKDKPASRRSPKKPMPENFDLSQRVKDWAEKNAHTSLERHLAHFRMTAMAQGYHYADWDSAFMKAISENWAKVQKPTAEQARKPDRYDLANAEFEAKYGKPDPMRKLLSGAVKGVPA